MWDSFVKNVGVVTAVATIVGSAIAFFVQRADELEQSALQAHTNERESKKVFLDKQADLYFEAVRVVSMIATAKTPGEINAGVEQRFWELYWGELGMVEDSNVEEAMALFGRSLHAFRESDNPDCAAERRPISLTLSHCVRKSLGKNWGVQLDVDKSSLCTDEWLRRFERSCPDPNADKAPPANNARPDPKLPTSRAN